MFSADFHNKKNEAQRSNMVIADWCKMWC